MQVCPSCGEENPAKFRLCGFCGAPLAAAPPPREIRKTVTIVFSDLKGSTSMAERLDSESLREVIRRYFEEMRVALERHGGRVEKYIGDAVMAVFGLPTLHEDDALRAVRAAADMKSALEGLNVELEERWGVTLTNRTGVNTGEVVVGDRVAGEHLVVGDAVNTAARLEQAAPAMEVLIGEPTYRLVKDAVDVENVAALELKGKGEPVPAYRLLAVRDGEAVARRHDAPIVGREAELALMTDTFRRVAGERSCRLLAVLGDAGVGKSRLIAELARAVAPEARVLRGRCLPYGQGITFFPLLEVVREAAAIREEDSPEEARARLGALLDENAADRVASAIGLLPDQFPVEETFWAARKLLETLAQDRPILLVFDDVHWAEATFLDLVDHVVASAREAPILLVCPSRRDLLETRPSWASSPDADRIVLEPLSEADAGRVVENLLGQAGIAEAPRARIVEAAEGNPLFVEQMLSMMIDDELLRLESGVWVAPSDLSDLAVPPTIHALMAARLDRLLEDERSVIDPASVAGLVFPRAAVEELVPDGLRDDVGAHLLALTGKHLVRPDTTSPHDEESFRFEHVLIRDAAYGGLLKRVRAALHERFAAWVERESLQSAVEYEEILGYHLEQAYRCLEELGPLDAHGIELGVRAAERLGAAGRRAFVRGDMPAAANLLRRGVATLPELAPLRLELLPDLGEALMDMGEFAAAEPVLDEAIEGASLIGDERLEAVARLVRLHVRRHTSDPKGWSDEVRREAERAIPLFEQAGGHAELARAWRLLFYVHATASRIGEATRAARRVIEHARLAGDARREGLATTAYATAALYGPTPVPEAIRECEEIVTQGLDHRQSEGIVLCALAHLRAMQGEIEPARELYGRARSILDDQGDQVQAATASIDSAAVEMLAGDPVAAERELRGDYETLGRMGEKLYLPTVAALLAQAVYAQGRYDEADELARVAEELAPEDDVDAQALWRCVRAKVAARKGTTAEAAQLARAAVDLLDEADGPAMKADALSDLAEVLLLARRTPEARAALEQAERLYERKGNAVSAARARALLARVANEPVPASP